MDANAVSSRAVKAAFLTILLTTPILGGNIDVFQAFNTAQQILLTVTWGLMSLSVLVAAVQSLSVARGNLAGASGWVATQVGAVSLGFVTLVTWLIYTLWH